MCVEVSTETVVAAVTAAGAAYTAAAIRLRDRRKPALPLRRREEDTALIDLEDEPPFEGELGWRSPRRKRLRDRLRSAR